MSRLIKGLASVAVLAGIGLAAQPAEAAPFLTVSLVGRAAGTEDAFTSSLNVNPGQGVEYGVRVQLAPAGTNNPFAGESITQTIHSWNPSPLYGLNAVLFSVSQTPLPGQMAVDFDMPIEALSTPASGAQASFWDGGTGARYGEITPRGDGNDDLIGVALFRTPGARAYDGIATNESSELLTIAQGTFDVAGSGGPATVEVGLKGFPFDPNQPNPFLAALKFRDPTDTGDVIYTPTLSQQLAGMAAGDPIIAFNSLTLVPEPATLGVLGTVGAIGLLSRRRRVN